MVTRLQMIKNLKGVSRNGASKDVKRMIGRNIKKLRYKKGKFYVTFGYSFGGAHIGLSMPTGVMYKWIPHLEFISDTALMNPDELRRKYRISHLELRRVMEFLGGGKAFSYNLLAPDPSSNCQIGVMDGPAEVSFDLSVVTSKNIQWVEISSKERDDVDD